MGSTVENSIEIDRPVDEVFAFVDDYKNVTRYVVGMSEYKPLTNRVSGKGSQFHFVKKTTGLPDIKSDIEITGWAKDKKITFSSFSGFENGGTYAFSPKGKHTVVRLSNSYDLASVLGGGRGGLFGGIGKAVGGVASKVAEGQVRNDITKSLENLRDLVQASGRRSTTKAATRPAPKAGQPAPKKTARR